MNAREELRLRVFELLLRNGFSLNNPEPFEEALDKIEAMVLGGVEATDGDETEASGDKNSQGNPSNPDPAKAAKGKK